MPQLYTLKIDDNLNQTDYQKLISYVSEDKKDRISRFRRFEDAQRTLLGDILAKYAICKKLKISHKKLIFGCTEYNKPLLIEPTGTHFNISHSGNWLLCGVDNNPIGVDVECIKPISLDIAKRFFSKHEYTSLINQPEEMRLDYFYMIWTLKESYIKADGKGLSIPLDSFTMIINNTEIKMTSDDETKEYHFYQSFLDHTAVRSVCTLDNNPLEMFSFNMATFLHEVRLNQDLQD